jgi:hypothetical protein
MTTKKTKDLSSLDEFGQELLALLNSLVIIFPEMHMFKEFKTYVESVVAINNTLTSTKMVMEFANNCYPLRYAVYTKNESILLDERLNSALSGGKTNDKFLMRLWNDDRMKPEQNKTYVWTRLTNLLKRAKVILKHPDTPKQMRNIHFPPPKKTPNIIQRVMDATQHVMQQKGLDPNSPTLASDASSNTFLDCVSEVINHMKMNEKEIFTQENIEEVSQIFGPMGAAAYLCKSDIGGNIYDLPKNTDANAKK